MKYFKQRTHTDCLLTVAEMFVQKPREKFGRRISWFKTKGYKFLTYTSLAQILRTVGGARIKFNGNIILDENFAILGHNWSQRGKMFTHALFWDGSRIYDPANGEFIPLKDLDITYCIVSKKNKFATPGQGYTDILKLCKGWDKNCVVIGSAKSGFSVKPIDNLIDLIYKGQMYRGDFNRVNSGLENK